MCWTIIRPSRLALLAAVLAVWLASLFRPATALAHANLVRTFPEANSVLQQSPAELRLSFTETPEAPLSEVRLLDRAGQRLDVVDRPRSDGSRGIPLEEGVDDQFVAAGFESKGGMTVPGEFVRHGSLL